MKLWVTPLLPSDHLLSSLLLKQITPGGSLTICNLMTEEVSQML
jgi:hypothetical protein